MKHRGLKFLFLLLSLALLVGLLSGMSAYAAEEYPIWIVDRQVTSDNTSGEGWSYNKDTKTLTLDDFSFTATPDDEYYYPGCIYIGSSSSINEITIELKGENTLTYNTSYGSGIFSYSALIFSGSGSLFISGEGDVILSSSNIKFDSGVYSGSITATGNTGLVSINGVIEIGGGTVTANGNNYGIESTTGTGNGIIITGGTVKADGGTNGPGLYSPRSSVKIDDGRVTASGRFGIRSGRDVLINRGSVIASGSQHAILGNVKNTIAGTGWTNMQGSEGKTTIAVNTQGQDLKEPGYKKVQFPAAADSFTVTLWPNGGGGEAIVNTDIPEDTIYELPTCNFMPPEGKTFTEWKLRQDDRTYKPGQKFTVKSSLDFDAQWKDASQGGDSDGGGSGSMVDLVFNIPGVDNSWEYAPGYAPQQAYRVSLAPMQGGSAALGLTTGDSGTALNVYPTSAVYVFPNANPGYTLDKIVWSLIDGSASYDITEAKNFIMPAMDVVVYVTFRPVG